VCNSLFPKIIKFADDNNYKLYFVDSQEYPEIPAQKFLMTFPALMVFFSGYEIIKMARFIDLAKLKLELEIFKNRFNL
jgi:thiol-disulfide isomerase/thioredoxin